MRGDKNRELILTKRRQRPGVSQQGPSGQETLTANMGILYGRQSMGVAWVYVYDMCSILSIKVGGNKRGDRAASVLHRCCSLGGAGDRKHYERGMRQKTTYLPGRRQRGLDWEGPRPFLIATLSSKEKEEPWSLLSFHLKLSGTFVWLPCFTQGELIQQGLLGRLWWLLYCCAGNPSRQLDCPAGALW